MTYKLTIIVTMLFAMATGLSAQVKAPNGKIAKPAMTATKDTFAIKLKKLSMPDMQVMESAYSDISVATGATLKDSLVTSNKKEKTLEPKIRKPDPSTATWLGLVFPGGGQIYNRKFWKLPIVYGGFVGCLYAYSWNVQMYKDYRQAYLDIMDSDPNTDSYKEFFRPGYDFEANKEYLQGVFKKRKDRYRRWRDLSIFSFIGVYALSVIDAYVDAQLSHFDISEDIHLSIEPDIINSRQFMDKDYYGLNLNISF